jgi:hypothetical protein
MDFPVFDGSDVRIWLDKCSAYFHLYSIPADFRVTISSLHMSCKASHWYQTYKHPPGDHTWEHFVVAVSREFEVHTHQVKTMELLNLRQTGSVVAVSSTLTDQYLINDVPVSIKDLIHEYEGIFHTPIELPPSREYDHSISLIPNATPVNCRPYRLT